MKMRSLSFVSGLVLSAAVIASILVTPAAAKQPPKPPPPPPPSSFSTYVKNYASLIDGVKCDVTPEVVQATSDGGFVALALSSRPSASASDSCRGVSWVVKFDASGSPQWQEVVGCFNLAPGSYAYGLSLQQTADGGYVIGGGTIGCGSTTSCAAASGIQCGLVEKLDSTGKLVWAQAYSAGASGSAINQLKPTSDGGFVAVGSATDLSHNTGALILKLDSRGIVQWQRQLGPTSSTQGYLNAVQQIADGGYVATGESSTPIAGLPRKSVLVVKLDSSGNVLWQRGYNNFDSSGAPTAAEQALSIIQSSEGGYLVAGSWGNTGTPGNAGALLLKLDANGNSQWQKAYSGGLYCFFNGYNETCTTLSGVAYSARQTSDGGYVLAGDGKLKLNDSTPLVPWLAKVDASGNLLWQHFYYQAHPRTGRPLSQYFASSDLTSSGGYVALGFTQNPTDLAGELFAVNTDSAGLVGACSQVHSATPLNAIDPGLATIALALPVQTTIAAQGNSPSRTQPTSISSTPGQC
jgi:hypothetical protein